MSFKNILTGINFDKVIYDPIEKDPEFNKEAINNTDIDKEQQSKNYITAKNLNDIKNVVNKLVDIVSSITLYLSNIESANSDFKGYNIIDYTPSNGITEISGNLKIDLSNFIQKNQLIIDENSIDDSIKNLDNYYLRLKNYSVDGNKVQPVSSYNLVSYESAENYITSSTILAMDYLTSYIKENIRPPELEISAGQGISISDDNQININLAYNSGLKINGNNQLSVDVNQIITNPYQAGAGLSLQGNSFNINLAYNSGLKINEDDELLMDEEKFNYLSGAGVKINDDREISINLANNSGLKFNNNKLLIDDNYPIFNNNLPVGSVIPFAGLENKIPSSFLLCNGNEVLKSEYPKLYNVLSTLYGEASDPAYFKLPDFRGMFLRGYLNGTTNNIGVKQNEGLPNITGAWGVQANGGSENGPSAGKGAIKTVRADGKKGTALPSLGFSLTQGGGWYDGGYQGQGIEFSAQWSNSIYGASSHVTPVNYAVYYIIKW